MATKHESARIMNDHPCCRLSAKSRYRVWDTVFETDMKYYPLMPLGRGTYGVVSAAFDLMTGEEVAIKKISNVFKYLATARSTLRELMILRQIQHQNVIALKHVMLPRDVTRFEDIYMVFERMETTLDGHIQSRGHVLFEDQIRNFLFEILCGVNYLHSANILHRDLKPDNILMDSNNHLKISDFGLSTATSLNPWETMSTYVVTRWYRAPELLLGNKIYGSSVDMWSVGCILAEMLHGKPIFPGDSTLNQLHLIINTLGSPRTEDLDFIQNPIIRRHVEELLPMSSGTPWSTIFPKADPYALDLLEKLLTFDPRKRITAYDALKHPYMSPYWDPRDLVGPTVPAWSTIKVDVEEDMDESLIKTGILREMLHYRKASY